MGSTPSKAWIYKIDSEQNLLASKIIYETTKRVIDIVLGSIFLTMSAPIILVAAVAITVESPGSPFFVQTRLGRNGKPFRLLKLRGMYSDAKERFPELYDYSGKNGLDFYFHHEVDPRVTRVGRFTRRASIDELPNFWNVVLGDMSLVGPRPEIPDVLALYGEHEATYLSVKPGVTCLSKCTGRDRLTKRDSIELDLDYVQNRSLRMDFRILWRTFCGVVLQRDVQCALTRGTAFIRPRKRMRILILGGSGFLGSHVVDRFLASDHNVCVYDLCTERYRRPPVGIEYFAGDLGNVGALEEVISTGFDAVLHFISTTTPKSSNSSPEVRHSVKSGRHGRSSKHVRQAPGKEIRFPVFWRHDLWKYRRRRKK